MILFDSMIHMWMQAGPTVKVLWMHVQSAVAMHTVSTQLAACIHENFWFSELKHFTKIVLLFSFFFSDRLQTFTLATGHGDRDRESLCRRESCNIYIQRLYNPTPIPSLFVHCFVLCNMYSVLNLTLYIYRELQCIRNVFFHIFINKVTVSVCIVLGG